MINNLWLRLLRRMDCLTQRARNMALLMPIRMAFTDARYVDGLLDIIGERTETMKDYYEPLRSFIECYYPDLVDWKEGETGNQLLWDNIKVVVKDNKYLYNYTDSVLLERNHPILMKCRGLVLDSSGKPFFYPFDRFFNEFEKEKTNIDWKTAEIQEKIDGTMIGVWFDGEKWVVTTRGSFYDKIVPEERRYDKFFWKIFGKEKIKELDESLCYVFELVSSKNRIVTKYSEEFVALIGARIIIDELALNPGFPEFRQRWLDMTAARLSVKRPERYGVLDNVDKIRALFSEQPTDFEGFVVVDADMHRIKIKGEEYMRLARIKNLSLKEIFYNIIGRKEKQTDGTITTYDIDPEFLKAFPEVEETRNKVFKWWKGYRQNVCDIFNEIYQEHEDSRKEFAFEAIKYPCKGMLFALLDNRCLEEEIKYESIKDILKEYIEKKQTGGDIMEKYEENKIKKEIGFQEEEIARCNKEIAKIEDAKKKKIEEYDGKIGLYAKLKQQHTDSKKNFEKMLMGEI